MCKNMCLNFLSKQWENSKWIDESAQLTGFFKRMTKFYFHSFHISFLINCVIRRTVTSKSYFFEKNTKKKFEILVTNTENFFFLKRATLIQIDWSLCMFLRTETIIIPYLNFVERNRTDHIPLELNFSAIHNDWYLVCA